MKQRSSKIPPALRSQLTQAVDRLIKLAEATGKPDEARSWREEEAKVTSPPTPATKIEAGKP